MQRLSSRADDPTPSIQDLAQRVVTLRIVCGQYDQGGSDEDPLLVAHIAWIGFAWHAERIPRLSPKYITGSSVGCGRRLHTDKYGQLPINRLGE